MSQVKYTRIPLDDPPMSDSDQSAFDFSSTFRFDNTTDYSSTTDFSKIADYSKHASYRSIFKYDGKHNNAGFNNVTGPDSFLTKCCCILINIFCYIFVILTFPVAVCFTIKTAKEYEKVVIFRLGRFHGIVGPGMYFVMPCIDRWVKVDTRTRAFSVPPQRMFTQDNAVIELGGDVFFSTLDVLSSVVMVQDMNHSLRILAQTTLQNHLSQQQLVDIDKNQKTITDLLKQSLNSTAIQWGVEISRIELSQPKILHPPKQKNPLGGGNPLENLSSALCPPGSSIAMCPPGSSANTPGGLNFESMIAMMPQMAQQIKQMQQGGGDGTLLPQQMPQTLPPNMAQLMSSMASAAAPMASTAVEMDPYEQRFTANTLLKAVQPILTEQLVRVYNTVFQFHITGDGGGLFYLDLKNGCGSAAEGDPPDGVVDVLISMSDADLDSLLKEQLKVFQAYVSGRLKVRGDLGAAMKLEEIIHKIKPRVQTI